MTTNWKLETYSPTTDWFDLKQLVECRMRTADKLVVLAECKPRPADKLNGLAERESRVADKIDGFAERESRVTDKIDGLAERESRVADKIFWELYDYDSSLEVASGVFDASHTNAFDEPNTFKELLWNLAGPSVGSISIFLNLLKDDLEEDQAGLQAGFDKIPVTLLALLAKEAGTERRAQIEYTEEILKTLHKISQTNSHKEAPSLDEGTNQEASKTQGTLPRAHKASPIEEAAIEPATPTEQDKEGAQSSSMASTG
jgi:hypothetical protein